jgi:hypothetical protein
VEPAELCELAEHSGWATQQAGCAVEVAEGRAMQLAIWTEVQ